MRRFPNQADPEQLRQPFVPFLHEPYRPLLVTVQENVVALVSQLSNKVLRLEDDAITSTFLERFTPDMPSIDFERTHETDLVITVHGSDFPTDSWRKAGKIRPDITTNCQRIRHTFRIPYEGDPNALRVQFQQAEYGDLKIYFSDNMRWLCLDVIDYWESSDIVSDRFCYARDTITDQLLFIKINLVDRIANDLPSWIQGPLKARRTRYGQLLARQRNDGIVRLEEVQTDDAAIKSLRSLLGLSTNLAEIPAENIPVTTTSTMKESMSNESPNTRMVFIIHGRNQVAVNAMKQFLRSLGLDPHDFDAVRNEMPGSVHLWQVVERALETARAIVVLHTPDEFVSLHPKLAGPKEVARWQPRPNVLIEAGLAMGIGKECTIVVRFGETDIASDFQGFHFDRVGNDPDSRANFRKRFAAIGCPINDSNDYLNPSLSGDFVECVSGYTNVTTRSPFTLDDDKVANDTVISNGTSSDKSNPETAKRELDVMRLASSEQLLLWRAEKNDSKSDYARAKFMMRQMGQMISSHQAKLQQLIPEAHFETLTEALQTARRLEKLDIFYGANGNYLLFWSLGNWVFKLVDAFASNPRNPETPPKPSTNTYEEW
jgi:predicted nucleotide-binding protein